MITEMTFFSHMYMILTDPARFIFLTYMFDKKVMIEEEDLFF